MRNRKKTGRSPNTTGVWNQVMNLRNPLIPGSGSWTTLPQFFKENGFRVAIGGAFGSSRRFSLLPEIFFLFVKRRILTNDDAIKQTNRYRTETGKVFHNGHDDPQSYDVNFAPSVEQFAGGWFTRFFFALSAVALRARERRKSREIDTMLKKGCSPKDDDSVSVNGKNDGPPVAARMVWVFLASWIIQFNSQVINTVFKTGA